MCDNKFDLFLSYSRSSIMMAEKISNELEKNGLLVWFDRTDVILGSEIYSNLLNTINSVKDWLGIVILFDNTFFYKEWCIQELELSLKNKLTIYPILYGIEKSEIPSSYCLNAINMVTIRKPDDFDYAINKIIYALVNKLPQTETTYLHSKIFKTLIESYNQFTRIEKEKVICADNIVRFLESTISNELTHIDLFLTKVIHNKCSKLFQLDNLSTFDIKVVCNSVNALLRKVKPID